MSRPRPMRSIDIVEEPPLGRATLGRRRPEVNDTHYDLPRGFPDLGAPVAVDRWNLESKRPDDPRFKELCFWVQKNGRCPFRHCQDPHTYEELARRQAQAERQITPRQLQTTPRQQQTTPRQEYVPPMRTSPVDQRFPGEAPRRKLVLHFDVNETIMIGDPVAGHSFEASLNNVLAKVAVIRQHSDNEWTWHDGTPLDPKARDNKMPPPELFHGFHLPPGCRRYFEVFREKAAKFTEPGSEGEIYRPQFEKLLDEMRWKHKAHPHLSQNGYHKLVPSFFHALTFLAVQKRDVSLVIRTFGTDLPDIAAAVSAFARGEHPEFPIGDNFLKNLELRAEEANWILYRPLRSDKQCQVFLRKYASQSDKSGLGADLSKAVEPVGLLDSVDREHEISTLLTSRKSIGVRDDYHFWRGHGYAPEAGKPLWITVSDETQHQIFFDDNIHNKENSDYDTIVGVRARRNEREGFRAVPLEVLNDLQGMLLVKVSPVAAALDRNYFLNLIDGCEKRLARTTRREFERLLFPH